MFTSQYELLVDWVEAAAQIDDAVRQGTAHEPGDTVLLDVGVSNAGEEADLILEGVVRLDDTGETVCGLPARALDSVPAACR